jgi:predicted RND superfamily exporter protein
MAISLSFGVMFATLVTLVLVPAGYMILEDFKNIWRWLYGNNVTSKEHDFKVMEMPKSQN